MKEKTALSRWGLQPAAAILAVLEDGERYGAAICNAVLDAAGIRVPPSRLYPTLHALTRAGLLESRTEITGRVGRPRIFYRLTEEGAAVHAEIRKQVAAVYGPGSS